MFSVRVGQSRSQAAVSYYSSSGLHILFFVCRSVKESNHRLLFLLGLSILFFVYEAVSQGVEPPSPVPILALIYDFLCTGQSVKGSNGPFLL